MFEAHRGPFGAPPGAPNGPRGRTRTTQRWQRWSLGPLVAGEYEQVYRAIYHFTLYDNLGEFLATLNMLARSLVRDLTNGI